MSRARAFYEGLLGMQAVWVPDPENVYLSSGSDNLALHQTDAVTPEGGRLDHFGFMVRSKADVDRIAGKMAQSGVPILKAAREHRDGSYSFYMSDPDGNVIQILYEPRVLGLDGP
jgi:catechol-2,3-dioxygenase